MKLFKTAALTALLIANQVSAMTFDDAQDQFSRDLFPIMGDTKVPSKFYEGATLERVVTEGNMIVYTIVTKDGDYFPGKPDGPKREVLENALSSVMKQYLCKPPYTENYPVTLVFRFENGADPISFHDSIMVNTKDNCK